MAALEGWQDRHECGCIDLGSLFLGQLGHFETVQLCADAVGLAVVGKHRVPLGLHLVAKFAETLVDACDLAGQRGQALSNRGTRRALVEAGKAVATALASLLLDLMLEGSDALLGGFRVDFGLLNPIAGIFACAPEAGLQWLIRLVYSEILGVRLVIGGDKLCVKLGAGCRALAGGEKVFGISHVGSSLGLVVSVGCCGLVADWQGLGFFR